MGLRAAFVSSKSTAGVQPHFFKHILGRLHQLGPLFDQGMAAAGLGGVDGARNCEHLLALLGGQSGGDQGARLERRLHHQRALRQAGNQAVAPGEVGRQRGRSQVVLADQQAVAGDAARQVKVIFRVDPVQPGAHHCHRGEPLGAWLQALQSALVRGSIDAPGQARNNGGTGGAQRPGKVLRIDGALYGGVAAAHNRQAVVMVKGD